MGPKSDSSAASSLLSNAALTSSFYFYASPFVETDGSSHPYRRRRRLVMLRCSCDECFEPRLLQETLINHVCAAPNDGGKRTTARTDRHEPANDSRQDLLGHCRRTPKRMSISDTRCSSSASPRASTGSWLATNPPLSCRVLSLSLTLTRAATEAVLQRGIKQAPETDYPILPITAQISHLVVLGRLHPVIKSAEDPD